MNELVIHKYEYHVWANERVMDHLATLPSDIFGKKVDLGFNSIAEIVSHLASADEIWLARIQEERDALIKPLQLTNLGEARIYFDHLQSRMREYLLTIDSAERIVSYKDSKGHAYQNSLSEILQHVVNHGTYHRGNISTMLRYLGYTGTPTDYLIYLRMCDLK